MRIVVTGALGHIGSRLIRELPASFEGAEVVLVDNLSTQRYGSLFNLPEHGHYRFIQADILEADLGAIFSGADVVVHLAAITDAEKSGSIAEQVERVNFAGTERVARACLASESRLLFVSTTSVYGSQKEVVDEDCPVEELRPQSPYAASKLRAEHLLLRMTEQEGLRCVLCRFGTIFGISIGMRFHTAINKFVWQACSGQPLTVWRTALHQRRPYLDLADAVRAAQFIIERDVFDGRVYNVLTVNATVEEILSVISGFIPDIRVEYVDSPIMNQLSYTVSCGRFTGLGFAFEGNLSRSVGDTVALLKGAYSFGEDAQRALGVRGTAADRPVSSSRG